MIGNKLIIKLEQRELGRVPELVAKLAIPFDTIDLEVDIAAYPHLWIRNTPEIT